LKKKTTNYYIFYIDNSCGGKNMRVKFLGTGGKVIFRGSTLKLRQTMATYWDDYADMATTEDLAVSAGGDGGSCRTQEEIRSWLALNYPASNYTVGFIMKVNHTYINEDLQILLCTSYFYEAKR
jgi:hypothetical protein